MNETRLKKALYKDDGLAIYVPRTECRDKHESFCRKIGEIKKLVAEADTKRELARKEDSEKWETLQNTLGRIDGYMQAHP